MNLNSARRIVTSMAVALAATACSEPPGPGAAPRAASPSATTDLRVTSVESAPGPAGTSTTSTRPVLETLPPVATVPRIPNAGSAQVLRNRWKYWETFEPGPLATANGPPPALLAPGRHTTDVLGIDTTLDLDDWWRLEAENPGSFWLTRPDAPLETRLPLVLFSRPAGLVDPGSVGDVNLLPGDEVEPPGDLGEWLARVAQIDVVARGRAVAGDRTGTWYDVDVEPANGPVLRDCRSGACVHAWWPGTGVQIVARDRESIRYYDFPDEQGPIYLIAVAADEEWDDWIDRADALIRATTFGPSAPHPVPPDVMVGGARGLEARVPMRFETFPGLVLTPSDHTRAQQRDGHLRIAPWGPNADWVGSVLVRAVETTDGAPLRSTEDVVELLAAAGLERGGEEQVVGATATVFSGEHATPLFRYAPVDDGDEPIVEWPEHPGFFRMWVFDSPIGPLVLAGEAESEGRLDDAAARARRFGDEFAFDCRGGECVVASG